MSLPPTAPDRSAPGTLATDRGDAGRTVAKRGRVWPRLLRWGIVCLLLAYGSCQVLGPDMDFPEDVDPVGTERITWNAPTGRVSGLQAGDPTGQRIVFVHGTPGFAASWNRYLTEVPSGMGAVALDRPGFGQSEPKGAVPSLSEQAAAVEPLLVERNGAWPILVGHSLGGPVILRVASDYPERVGGLIVLAGNIDPELEKLHWYNQLGRLVSPFLSRSWRNSNRELIPHRKELEELVPGLERITCPVIIVHGTEDSLVPYANAEFLERSLPSAASVELERLDGVDHFFVFQNPGILWTALHELTR